MKKFSSLKWGIFTLFSFSYFFSFSQKNAVLLENELIVVSASYSECDNAAKGTANNYLLLSVENKTDKQITIRFNKEVYFNGVCSSCKNEKEMYTELTLEPNEKRSGNCESSKDLKVFHSMNSSFSKQKLTDLKITNFIQIVRQ